MSNANRSHEQAQPSVVWTDLAGIPVAQQILTRMGSSIVVTAVGGPRVSQIEQFAHALGCPACDDARKLLLDRPGAFGLIVSMAGVESSAVWEAVSLGSRLLTVDPIDTELGTMVYNADGLRTGNCSGGAVVYVPAFDKSEGWTSAADPLDMLGQIRLVRFSSYGGLGEGSLFARLYDAWRIILKLGEVPDTVDASLASATNQEPQDLRSISGHMAAHARMSTASALLDVSDGSGPNGRQLLVAADDGQLSIGEQAYELRDATGQHLDGQDACEPPLTFADAIAQQWQSLLNGSPRQSIPTRNPMVADDEPILLASCLACLLSARTGQPESPRKLLAAHSLGQ